MWESDDELNDEFEAQPPFIQVCSPVLPPIFSVFYFDLANSIVRLRILSLRNRRRHHSDRSANWISR